MTFELPELQFFLLLFFTNRSHKKYVAGAFPLTEISNSVLHLFNFNMNVST